MAPRPACPTASIVRAGTLRKRAPDDPSSGALPVGPGRERPAACGPHPGRLAGLSGSGMLWALGAPALAEACATCLSTPWGDRSYTWAYLGLLLMPFLVVAAIGGVLAYLWRAARRPAPGRETSEIEETL